MAVALSPPKLITTSTPQPLVKAPSVILQGDSGTGKTDVLVDLITQGLELFVLITEPNGLDSLLDSVVRRKADINKLHWHIVEPARAGFDDLDNMFMKISVNTHEGLSKQSPGLRQGAKILEVVANFRNFHCQRTNQQYGSIAKFDTTKAVALDSLSGVSEMAWDVTVGNKVTAHQGEWGVAMNGIKKLVSACTSNLQCTFVMTAHLARELDEVHGGSKIMVNTLGKKLAPDIPKFFSEVVTTKREGGKFLWSTDEPNTISKCRALGLSPALQPSFKPVIDAYVKRIATIGQAQ